jgi:hypothetical protein
MLSVVIQSVVELKMSLCFNARSEYTSLMTLNMNIMLLWLSETKSPFGRFKIIGFKIGNLRHPPGCCYLKIELGKTDGTIPSDYLSEKNSAFFAA